MKSLEYPAPGTEPTPGEFTHRTLPCETHGNALHARPHESQGMGPQPFVCVPCAGAKPIRTFWTSDEHIPETKDTNPKDAIADGKVPLGTIPLPAVVEESLALLEGALKYGSSNWTISGVRASVYVFACIRHVLKWYFGQQRDTTTQVHHLGNARACLAILLDAEHRGKLNDDRPPSAPDIDALFARAEDVIKNLHKLYGDQKPRHYTIADSE